MKHIAALILWSASFAAIAQPMPPGPPPHGPGVPAPEALATVPNLTGAQQTEVRKILIERRDAHEAVAAKARAEREAAMKKDRGDHERIDEQSAERLRKLLGDDGYRQFAEWQLAHRPMGHERGRDGHDGPQDGPRRGPRPGPGHDKVAALPGGPDGDDDAEQ